MTKNLENMSQNKNYWQDTLKIFPSTGSRDTHNDNLTWPPAQHSPVGCPRWRGHDCDFDARQGEGAKSLKKIFGRVGGVVGLPQGLVGPKMGKIEAYKKKLKKNFFENSNFFLKNHKKFKKN